MSAPLAEAGVGARGQKRTAARKKGKRTEVLTRSLQEQAFYLNLVDGKSSREIAKILNIDKTTAAKYIREETARRSKELDAERDAQTARSVAFYDEVAARGMKVAEECTKPFNQQLVKGLDTAVKARERRDKILGIDAPVKIDAGLSEFLEAINSARPE